MADSVVLNDPLAQAAYTEWQHSGGRREACSQFVVSGLQCAACAASIERTLRRQPGVLSASVNAASERLLLRWNPAQTQLAPLVAAVEALGFGAAPDMSTLASVARRRESRAATWRLFVAAFAMMQVMMLALPLYLAAPGEIPDDQRQLLNWASWVLSVPVMLFSAAPFFTHAARQLRHGRIGMDAPVALALAVTFIASTGATFSPGGVFGHEVYFDSLTMFVALLLGARRLELGARHRAARTLEQTADALPAIAYRLEDDGTTREVAALRLRPGDRIRVPLGETFPADGVVIEGRTRADESLLTGESRPQWRGQDDEVIAGSLNVQAPVVVRVLRTGADTRREAIVALMRNALAQRPTWFALADRIAGPFLWIVIVLAAGAAAVWSMIDPSRAVWVSVSVLIVTCPCALSLAAPTTLLAAASALARRGVLLQRLDALEPLASAQQVFVDKTGTVTDDRLEVADVVALDRAQTDVGARLGKAAGLAACSTHAIARSIANAVPAVSEPWTDVREVPGAGLEGVDADGLRVRLGSAAWLGIHAEPARGPVAWFGPIGAPWMRIELREALRPDARDAIAALQADGLRVTLLSGDAPERVALIAERLGVDAALGGATPQSKLDALAAAQADARVCAMVGDGINDAPVLARADVSFAMGQGAVLARSRADATLLSMRLTDIVFARRIALRARRIVRQNLTWAVLYNATCIPLALIGWLPPWAAGIGMASSSLIVVVNALRVGRTG